MAAHLAFIRQEVRKPFYRIMNDMNIDPDDDDDDDSEDDDSSHKVDSRPKCAPAVWAAYCDKHPGASVFSDSPLKLMTIRIDE